MIGIISWLMMDTPGSVWILLSVFILYINCPRISTHLILNPYAEQKLTFNTHPELLNKIHYLASTAGLKNMPEVYRSEFKFINAFTMKINKQTVIVVSNGLIEHLDNSKTMAVLAHEISHIYHNDIHFMRLVNNISQFTQALSAMGLILLIITPFLNVQNTTAHWSVILTLLFTHYATDLLQLSLSRSREFYADIIVVQLTNDVNSMISALKKIEHENTNWFKNIAHRQNKSATVSFLRSHPSTQERIHSLHGLGYL